MTTDKKNATRNGEADSVDFAIYLNQKAKQLKQYVNMTKIQKWLYICYGLYLAMYGKPLFAESPKAWDYGPVFPRVYKQQRANHGLDSLEMSPSAIDYKAFDEIITATINHFGDWSTDALVTWTHEEGKAWDKKFNNGSKYAYMDDVDILFDFKGLVSDE